MNKFIEFDKEFPNSSYREVHKQYNGEDYKKYQASKAPLNKKILTFDQIKNTENRVGWIVPEEYIVIDIDNMLEAKKIFDILLAKKVKYSFTTSKKGGHFIFKNDKNVSTGANFITSIGITVDTRSQGKGYIILPHNDTDRTWGTISNNIDNLPFYLLPLKDLKTNIDLLGLKDGDGRNDAMYRHFLNLKDYADDLTVEEKVQSIHIINDYILKERLSDSELNTTVLRKELIEKEPSPKGRKRKRPSEEEIATKIVSERNYITVDDITYLYDGKYYKRLHEKELERIIHDNYDVSLKEHTRKEIIKFVKLKTFVPNKEVNKAWNEIVVKNGILNISDGQLYPHNPSHYNTVYIDHNYIKDAPYSSYVDNFFNTIIAADKEKKNLLYEIVGYALLRKPIFSKFFICYGQGQTGKSTYLNLIKLLVGADNTTHLSISDLEGPYNVAELFGKLVNLGDDIDFKRVANSSILKKLTSGDPVNTRRIYGEPFDFNNFAKLVWTTNELPPINDRSSGLYRRLVIIDMNNVIENPDPFFLDKITTEDFEYLLSQSIYAIQEALRRGKLTESEELLATLEAYKTSQSSVLSFLMNRNYATRETLKGKVIRDVYAEYKDYCIDEAGFKPLNQINFKKEVNRELKMFEKNTTFEGANQQRRFWY